MKGFGVLSEILAIFSFSIIFMVSFSVRGEARDTAALLAKLESPDPLEHSNAMDELRKATDDETVSALMKIVEERRDDWKLQIAAIRLLGEIANPLATDLLIRVVTDHLFTNECPALKWNGIVALGSFRQDSRVVDALLYRLDEATLYLREAVIESLGRIGNKEAVPYIISALNEKSFAVRMSAVKALGAIEDPRAIPHLKKIADRDADPLLRDEALKALARLTKS